jgi:hypothetical protein
VAEEEWYGSQNAPPTVPTTARLTTTEAAFLARWSAYCWKISVPSVITSLIGFQGQVLEGITGPSRTLMRLLIAVGTVELPRIDFEEPSRL